MRLYAKKSTINFRKYLCKLTSTVKGRVFQKKSAKFPQMKNSFNN